MAKTLSTSGINSGQLIRTTQLTQVVDAFTGNDGYDIEITGSLTVSGSTDLYGVTSGSFVGDGSGLTGVTGEWDGSHLGNASITGSLTVTSDLSSSGNLIGTDITASGNISSSGDMYASNITFPDLAEIIGEARLTISSSNAQVYYATEYGYYVNGGNVVSIKSDEVEFRKPIDSWYSITASADISSSEHISGKSISVGGDIYGNVSLFGSGSGTYLSGTDTSAQLRVKGAQKINIYSPTSATGNITFNNIDSFHINEVTITRANSSITASGDISSSGTITGLSGSFSELSGASPLTINGIVNFSNPITSSGNISSSGDLYVESGHFGSTSVDIDGPGGHITASGTISMLTASIGGGIFTSASLAAGGGGGSTFPYTGDAEITGSLIVSGSGGTDITANNLFLYDGVFGPTGYSYGIKINTQEMNYSPPNTKGGNISIGASAGNSITDNSFTNVFIGDKAGYSNTFYQNIMIGKDTGYWNLGTGNIFMGMQAGYYGEAGNQYNIALGYFALKGSETDNISKHNIAIGREAGISVSDGEYNTILGYKSGYDITSGSGNVIIGNYAAEGSGNIDDQLIIGSSSLATISASLTTGDIMFPGSASFTGLPTSEPSSVGALWISGSSPTHPNSGFLMVYNP